MSNEHPSEKQLAHREKIKIKTHEQAVEMGRKGGLVCSPKKRLSAIINALKRRKGLTEIQATYLAYIQEGKLDLVADGLLSELVSQRLTSKGKLEVLDRFIKRLPTQTMNLNVNKSEIQINIQHEYSSLKDIIFKVLDKYPEVKKEVLMEIDKQIAKSEKEGKENEN